MLHSLKKYFLKIIIYKYIFIYIYIYIVENVRTKYFSVKYPDKNRKLNDYHSIDSSKD